MTSRKRKKTMGMMLAARYTAANCVETVELKVPALNEGEALVRVEACGICGSDLNVVAGLHPRARAPLTLGHEFCGRVVEIRSAQAPAFEVGDRVAVYPLIACGRCYACRHNNTQACRELRVYGFDADGGMAEFARLPVANLVKIPDSLSLPVAALLEPLAVGIHALSRVSIQPTDTVVVLGAGTIGLVTALSCRNHKMARLFVTDVLGARLELARELGFEALDARDPNLPSLIRGATDGEGADVVFECTGAPAAALQMTDLVRSQGSIVNCGVFKKPAPVNLQAVNFKELVIMGSRVYSLRDFELATKIASSLPMDKLITLCLPLQQAPDAFGLLMSGAHAGKVLLEVSETQF
jgi:(R,R)-butanediol dehydrogenase / meso-butanediol dehydrogenase / diacetyl reductase